MQMKSQIVALFLIAILLAASSAGAKTKSLLRLNLQKGNSFEMAITTTSKMDQEMNGKKLKNEQKLFMVFDYQVLDKLPNKNYLIEYSILKMKMDMSMNGYKETFDSESSDTTNHMNTAVKGFISTKLKIEMTPKGKVERVEGLEQYDKIFSENSRLAQSIPMLTNEKSLGSFVNQIFNYFPEAKVGTGDKWTSTSTLPFLMDLETKMNFEVAALERNSVRLKVASDVNFDAPLENVGMKIDMKMTGTQNGTMTIDSSDGWIRSSDLTQNFDMKMKMKDQKTGEDVVIPMVVNSEIKLTSIKK